MRPPSKGAAKDFGREESAIQQRLSEQVRRWAQLCIPIPDTAVRPRSRAPLGSEQGRQDRSRSPFPKDPRRRLLPSLEAVAVQEPQSSANPALLTTERSSAPRPDGSGGHWDAELSQPLHLFGQSLLSDALLPPEVIDCSSAWGPRIASSSASRFRPHAVT